MMKKNTVAVVVALMFSGTIHAAEEVESLGFLPFWYAGVSLNYGHYLDAQNGSKERTGLNHIVDGVHLGHQFNPYLGAEVEYQYLGNAGRQGQAGELRGSYRQLATAIRLGHALTERTYGYVKVGVSGWMEVDERGEGLSGVVGVGASYQLLDNLALRLEYQYTDRIGNASLGESSHHMGALGVSYAFGRTKPVIIERVRDVVVEREVEKVITKTQTIVLNGRTQLLFATNSSVLENTESLEAIVEQLKKQPTLNVTVAGYTDDVGSEKYNLWLSGRRAQRVADYFVQQGIESERIEALGFGGGDPIVKTQTKEGRAMNRRVEITLVPSQADTQ